MEPLVSRQSHGLEHGGPEYGMGLENIFCNHMLGHRPVFFVIVAVGPVQSGHIVDQGVKPDIGDKVVVKGQRYAPGQSRGGPGDTEILKGFAQKRQNLVAVALRCNVLRI